MSARELPVTYELIIARAENDESYRDGLNDAAMVARAQGQTPNTPPCPSSVAAVYIEALARGEMP